MDPFTKRWSSGRLAMRSVNWKRNET
jgi:hypothetical protein